MPPQWLHLHGGSRAYVQAIAAAFPGSALCNKPVERIERGEERECFSAWRYEPNKAVLHTDASVMPPDPGMWAFWNYRDEGAERQNGSICVTYHLNRLQGLEDTRQYFLTLNPSQTIPEEAILGR
jgi:predicted NAD/FAD-binding protein